MTANGTLSPPSVNGAVSPVAIGMNGITKRFGETVANRAVTFNARFGEIHALIGENGAGKSTLMSILAGLYRPDEGEVTVAGEPRTFRSPRDAIEAGIGMVYQHFMLVETLTVAENVLLGLPKQPFRLKTAEVERELAALAEKFGLDVDPRAHIWQLSVGEQQRVEILRLLYRGARILVFDEPTAVLTPHEAKALIATLRGMATSGYCIVFISHKLDEVLAVADRITVLRRGETVATLDRAEADHPTLAQLMVGRPMETVQHGRTGRDIGSVVLAARDLEALSDRGTRALHALSLELKAGEVFGIAGVAGNGQRELAEVLTGLRPTTAGTLEIRGKDVTNASPGQIARQGVAHIPEDRLATGLAGGMRVDGNAILRDYPKAPFAWGPFINTRAVADFTDRLITEYDVKTPSRGTRVRSLSGGNQQKLLIARELSGQPAVVVAVHPTRGVDIGATETIHRLLREQRERGAAILLISEDLDELRALSDRIGVLYGGRLLDVLPTSEADIDRLGRLMAGLDKAAELAGQPVLAGAAGPRG